MRPKNKADLRSGRGCWYEVWVFACPLCGRADEYRERRWSRKPPRPERRYHLEDSVCPDHFFS